MIGIASGRSNSVKPSKAGSTKMSGKEESSRNLIGKEEMRDA